MNGKVKTPGVTLAVSGGGFRATLFHLGSLWRLNELGLMRKLKVITSVSGGSIAAGYLGLRWRQLQFDADDRATNFRELVVDPLRKFCLHTYDVTAGLIGMLPGLSGGDRIARVYRKELFGDATLQDLPDEASAPRFILYATSLQTGASVRFSKTFLRDYKVGLVRDPTVPLARVVAASSAFPPVLSPLKIDMKGAAWTREEGNVHYGDPDFTETLVLTDGGVYDNMGLEAIWDRYETVLVSDAGAPFAVDRSPSGVWLKLAIRVIDIQGEQARSLRKRWLVNELDAQRMRGAYWGIATRIGDYGLADAIVADSERTRALAGMRTRLNAFSPEEQAHLINWGYSLADAAIRKYVPKPNYAPGAQPYPGHGL